MIESSSPTWSSLSSVSATDTLRAVADLACGGWEEIVRSDRRANEFLHVGASCELPPASESLSLRLNAAFSRGPNAAQQLLRSGLEAGRLLVPVAEADDRVVACGVGSVMFPATGGAEPTGEVHLVAVDAQWRRRGLATEAIAQLSAMCGELGSRWMWGACMAGNESALEAWKSMDAEVVYHVTRHACPSSSSASGTESK